MDRGTQHRRGLLWLVRAPVVAFIGVSLILVYRSPSVLAFKSYARAATPLIAEVCRYREEMAQAAALWLVDPPAFSPPGSRARERVWSQIAGLVHDGPVPTRTLHWKEWAAGGMRDRVPEGVQVYGWRDQALERLW